MGEKSFTLVLEYDNGQHPPVLYTTTCEVKYRAWKDRTMIGRVERRLRKPSTGLDFVIWHSGGSRGLPMHRPSSGNTPSWISIRNTQVAPSVTARNVTARLEFVDSKREQLLIVPEAVWFEQKIAPRTERVEGYRHDLEIAGGDEQSFIFFVQTPDGDITPYRRMQGNRLGI